MKNHQDSIYSKSDFDGKDVFEIGTGFGSFTLEYLIDAKSIFGIDTNQETVDFMRSDWPGTQEPDQVHFREDNIVDIDLDGKVFDWVVFSNSF